MNSLLSTKNEKTHIMLVGVLMLVFYALILLPKEIFFYLIQEDGIFENSTALFFLSSAVVFFLLFLNGNYLQTAEYRSLFSNRKSRYTFLLLALVFFFGFGEEISWGQRIFGFATPEGILENNSQEEFNIHNLELFDVKDKQGVRKGTLAKLFTMKQLFLYSFSLYLFLFPLLNKTKDWFRKLAIRFFIPIPPLWLGILFICNYIVYRIVRLATDGIIEKTMSHGLTEMQEFNFSILLLILPFTFIRLFSKG